MFRWLRIFCVCGILAVLAGAGARAAVSRYDVPLQADGATLGTASGSVDVSRSADGRFAWKLEDGKFTAAALNGGSVLWDDAFLSGSGTVDAAPTITLKSFEVTVRQTSGVDISYRFQIAATLDGETVKSIAITQQT